MQEELQYSKFKWPTVEDATIIDNGQIEIILHPHNISPKTNHVTSLTFKTDFEGLSVS